MMTVLVDNYEEYDAEQNDEDDDDDDDDDDDVHLVGRLLPPAVAFV